MKTAMVRVVASWRPDKRYGFVRVASGGTFPECRVDEVPVLVAYGDGVEPLSGGVSRADVLKEWREAYRAVDGLFVEIDGPDASGALRVHTQFAKDGAGVSGLVHGTDEERDAASLAAAVVNHALLKHAATQIVVEVDGVQKNVAIKDDGAGGWNAAFVGEPS